MGILWWQEMINAAQGVRYSHVPGDAGFLGIGQEAGAAQALSFAELVCFFCPHMLFFIAVAVGHALMFHQ